MDLTFFERGVIAMRSFCLCWGSWWHGANAPLGVDQVAISPWTTPFTGDQRTDAAVNIEPHFLHILV